MRLIRRTIICLVITLLSILTSACSSIEGKGDSAAKQGNWDQAVAHYRLAYADDPNPVLKAKLDNSINQAAGVHFQRGQGYLNAEKFSEAITEFVAVLKYDRSYPSAKEALDEAKAGKKKKVYQAALSEARDHIRNRKLDAATQALQKAIETYERNTEARNELDKLERLKIQAESHITQGNTALQNQEWSQANVHFGKALDIWADNARALAGKTRATEWIKYQAHMAAGKKHLDSGNDKAAHSEFQSAQGLKNTDEAKTLLKEIGERLYPKTFLQAQEALDAAEAIRGNYSAQSGKFADALRLFEEARSYKETATVGQKVAYLKKKLSTEAQARGLRAINYRDYEAAVEAFEIAGRFGSPNKDKLNEARYLKNLWAGYQAEANGLRSIAKEFYQEAAPYSKGTDVSVAMLRLTKERSAPASGRAIITAASPIRSKLEADFRQRMFLNALHSARNLDDISDFDARDPQLGSGIDSLTLRRRNKVVMGRVAGEEKSQEKLFLRKRSVILSDMLKTATDVGVSYGIPLFGVGGQLNVENLNESSYSKLVVEFRYQVITRKETLEEPTIGPIDNLDLGEWLDTYGTHYVSEIWYGGLIKLELSKEVKNEVERKNLSAKIEGSLGPLSASAGHTRALQSLKDEINFTVKVESKGCDLSITSFEDYIRLHQSFRDQVRRSKGEVVLIQLRSYASLGRQRGFPYDPKVFTTVVRRQQAERHADYMLKVAHLQGQQEIAEERRRENARRLAAAKRKRDLLQSIANKFSGKKRVWQSSWIPIDFSDPSYPASITLRSFTLTTKDRIEAFLLPPNAWQAARKAGWLKDDKEFTGEQRQWLVDHSKFYTDTIRQNAEKQNLNIKLPRGEYRLLLYSHVGFLGGHADVTYSASISN